MKVTIFLGFVAVFALAILGRRLREEAFRALPAAQRVDVLDKLPNYSSTEMIPFAGLVLGFLGVCLLRPERVLASFPVFLGLVAALVATLHLRTRRRFRELGLPPIFLARYERSRVVTYSALAVLFAVGAWALYL